MKIYYKRRSVCMGDDADCGVYMIEMPDGSTLGDLIHVAIHGGYGNTWPIPILGSNWQIVTNLGKVADLGPKADDLVYTNYRSDEKLSDLGITWIFGEQEGRDIDLCSLEKTFNRFI